MTFKLAFLFTFLGVLLTGGAGLIADAALRLLRGERR